MSRARQTRQLLIVALAAAPKCMHMHERHDNYCQHLGDLFLRQKTSKRQGTEYINILILFL